MVNNPNDRQTVATYLQAAHQALAGSQHNLNADFFGIAVNRAYYAVFYAANALLITKGVSRSKHSGTIGAFRQYFVKPGLIEPEYSDIYGNLMSDRHISDYNMDMVIEAQRAEAAIQDARQFVERIETYLRREKWL